MSFAIANNLLAPNTKAIDLGISPQLIMAIARNNSKDFKDGSFSMKHLDLNDCENSTLWQLNMSWF
jgi:hypothetical protein